jgi:hypothetical protein
MKTFGASPRSARASRLSVAPVPVGGRSVGERKQIDRKQDVEVLQRIADAWPAA